MEVGEAGKEKKQMTLKDVLVQVVKIAKEVQTETGFMFSSEAVVSLAQTVYNNALKDIRVELMNGNGKGTYKQPGQVKGKLATEKQISLLQKIDKENGGAVMKDLLTRGIETTAGLTMAIASELITKFSKGSGRKAETPASETKKQEVAPQKETATEKLPVTPNPTGEKASDKQIKYLWALAIKLGHGNGQTKGWLTERFKVASLNDLTKTQAKSGIASLQSQIN